MKRRSSVISYISRVAKSRDIRRKLLITLLILVIYRLCAHVPVPGVNKEAIDLLMTQGGAGTNLIGLLDMLSGGTVSNFSVMAMGVYPYITAQIIIQILAPLIPAWTPHWRRNWPSGMEPFARFLVAVCVGFIPPIS